MILLPPSAPFSIYNFACWARQTVVPLSVVLGAPAGAPGRRRPARDRRAPGRDERRRARPSALRRRALAAAERWVRERQEADGSWGGIQPPWVWSIVMLAALGRGFEDETLRRAVEGWDGVHGRGRRPAAPRGVPVAGLGHRRSPCSRCAPRASRPTIRSSRKAGEWLLAEEVTVKGDWAIRRPDLAPGGWAFEFENDLYPDVDDTAVVALALRELGMGEEAVRRGLDWIEGMQSRERRLGRLRRRQLEHWLYKLPFCDFGYVIDPPSEDVSAHALEALAPRRRATRTRSRRGLEYLAPRAAGGRLLVGPLGGQPRLRHRRGAAGARGVRFRAGASGDAARPWTGWTRSSRPTAASARTSAPTTRRPCAAAAHRPLHKRPGRY